MRIKKMNGQQQAELINKIRHYKDAGWGLTAIAAQLEVDGLMGTDGNPIPYHRVVHFAHKVPGYRRKGSTNGTAHEVVKSAPAKVNTDIDNIHAIMQLNIDETKKAQLLTVLMKK